MSFTVPNFNVTCDVWIAGEVPADDLPTYEGVACQFYVPSRGILDITPGELELWSPPIYIRMPLAAGVAWKFGMVFEVQPGDGMYYRARWKERVHLGFPNEYLTIVVEQCNADGTAILRDVEWAEGFDRGVSDESGSGEMHMSYEMSFDGEATNGGDGELHGEGQIFMFFEMQFSGSAQIL